MEITCALPSNVPAIIALIQKRIDWMDEQGLCQWNKTAYLDVYNLQYFTEKIKEHSIFIAREAGALLGVIALFTHDGYWEDNAPALYLHHLATAPRCGGVGSALLAFAEAYAKARNIKTLRLDNQQGNIKLDEYYGALGYALVGQCVDGQYIGNKREKKLP